MLMPNEAVFAQFTLRMARIVSRLALHDGYDSIAQELNTDRRTVAGDVARAKTITGCETQTELVHWWQANCKPLARWMLRELGIDPSDLVA